MSLIKISLPINKDPSTPLRNSSQPVSAQPGVGRLTLRHFSVRVDSEPQSPAIAILDPLSKSNPSSLSFLRVEQQLIVLFIIYVFDI